MPTATYVRPDVVDETGLVFTLFGESGGVEGTWDFSRLAGSLVLKQALAAGFARLAGPSARWRAWDTCDNSYYAIRRFTRHLADLERPPRSAAEITPAVWASWKLSCPDTRHGVAMILYLKRLLPEVEGIPVETLHAVDRRVGTHRQQITEVAYRRQDLDRIKGAAATMFNTALIRIRTNREHLRRWYNGQIPDGTDEDRIGAALDCLLRTGDVPLTRSRWPRRRVSESTVRLLGGNDPELTWGRLFLTPEEACALSVLLVASESWNKSVLHRMRIPEHDPAVADDFDIHLVEVHKARRPVHLRYTTNNLVDAGPDSPGRLMGRAIEATDLARQYLQLRGTPTDRLLICRLRNPRRKDQLFRLGIPPDNDLMQQFAAHANLHNPDGSAMNVSLRRIRRTVQVLIRKEPAHNSQETHDTVYMLPDPATREQAKHTIAEGLTDALEHARTITAMKMLLGEDADVLIELSDHPDLAQAILDGKHDTATSACTDFDNSPITGPGPCTASFLWCLACKNAIATRRHLPRLVYLHHCLESLRATVAAEVWELDWREHHLRLSSLLTRHTTGAQQQEAVRTISGSDRDLIDRLLRRGFDA
ncbi:hypothetical protein KUTG_09502 [Kutzneria sp. 744]|nr:hypothetical protein KUTG_09502 [Kutzneria sp. 744]